MGADSRCFFDNWKSAYTTKSPRGLKYSSKRSSYHSEKLVYVFHQQKRINNCSMPCLDRLWVCTNFQRERNRKRSWTPYKAIAAKINALRDSCVITMIPVNYHFCLSYCEVGTSLPTIWDSRSRLVKNAHSNRRRLCAVIPTYWTNIMWLLQMTHSHVFAFYCFSLLLVKWTCNCCQSHCRCRRRRGSRKFSSYKTCASERRCINYSNIVHRNYNEKLKGQLFPHPLSSASSSHSGT